MGTLIDKFGYSSLFYTASGGMIIALLLVLGVKDRGMAHPISPEQQASAL